MAFYSRIVFVIGTSVYFKYTTKGIYAMLEAKYVNSIQSFFECGVNMAIAFFKIRFSSSS